MTHSITHNRSFSGAAATTLNARPGPSQHDKLLDQAQRWVSQTFFGTLMKQLRDSPFRSKLLDGGRGGEAFGSLYDQHLADHMSRGVGRKLAESIAKKIEARTAYGKAAKTRGRSDAELRTHLHTGRAHVPPALRA